MITYKDKFFDNLELLQNNVIAPRQTVLVLKNEPVYNINLNTRSIEAPEFISVKKDQASKTIYFIVDRMFGNVDLAKTICVIQYINANGEGRVYPVPFYDLTTLSTDEKPKILFPWVVGGEATAAAGVLEFAVRFYRLSEDELEFIYDLNTTPAKTKILYGLDTIHEQEGSVSPTEIERIYNKLIKLEVLAEQKELHWIDFF